MGSEEDTVRLEEDDDPMEDCSACSATGEGQADGTSCSSCGGKGHRYKPGREPEPDPPDPHDYFDDRNEP